MDATSDFRVGHRRNLLQYVDIQEPKPWINGLKAVAKVTRMELLIHESYANVTCMPKGNRMGPVVERPPGYNQKNVPYATKIWFGRVGRHPPVAGSGRGRFY